jgi:hypothetical protein
VAGICECGSELSGSIKCTNNYRSMQIISNISGMQINLNADKSDMSANMDGKDHLEDLGVKERKSLKCSLKKLGTKVWSGLIYLNIDQWHIFGNMIMNLKGS